jgi:hypothetical protein
VAHGLSCLPDLPTAEVLLARLPADPTLRGRYSLAVQRTPDEPTRRATLAAARATEQVRLAALTADLVLFRLGERTHVERLSKTLSSLSVQEIRDLDPVFAALGESPQLATLLTPWLDDRREVGTFSHRETRPSLVRDVAAWHVHGLGVRFAGDVDHPRRGADVDIAAVKQARSTLPR